MEQLDSGRLDIPQPAWLHDAVETVPRYLLDDERRMREVLRLAQLNGLEYKTGFPLAGAFFQTNGMWIAGGVEFVQQGVSGLAHPAMAAIQAAYGIYGERLFDEHAPGKEVPELHYFGVCDQCLKCLRALTTVRHLKVITMAATADDVKKTLGIRSSPLPCTLKQMFRGRTRIQREFLRREAVALLKSYAG